jgi:hypothetical protein
MSRLIFAALIAISATPAFAGTAHTTMSVGVMVVYDPLPAPAAPVQAPLPQPAASGDSNGH